MEMEAAKKQEELEREREAAEASEVLAKALDEDRELEKGKEVFGEAVDHGTPYLEFEHHARGTEVIVDVRQVEMVLAAPAVGEAVELHMRSGASVLVKGGVEEVRAMLREALMW